MGATFTGGFRRFRAGLALATLGGTLLPAWGWGPVAHRTIGAIADAHLTPAAKTLVARTLGGATLADVANWADAVRATPEYAHTAGYHFEQMADGETYVESLRRRTPRQLERGGLVAALMAAHLTLRDPRAPARDKTDALKFLAHLAGDVHQPLHTGRPEDRGGSMIHFDWFGRRTTLHRAWDSGLILAGHPDLLRPELTAREVSDTYAQRLLAQFAEIPVNVTMDVRGWMEESVSLRPAAYYPLYETDAAGYVAWNIADVDRRVYVAGFRLAKMLNDIAARRPPPDSEGRLWEEMKSIMGDPRQIIRLRPLPGADRGAEPARARRR